MVLAQRRRQSGGGAAALPSKPVGQSVSDYPPVGSLIDWVADRLVALLPSLVAGSLTSCAGRDAHGVALKPSRIEVMLLGRAFGIPLHHWNYEAKICH